MTIPTIKGLLISGQTEEALNQLLHFSKSAPSDTQNSVILLKSAWEYQEKEAINGTLSFSDAELQRSKIVKGVLSLLADMEEDGIVSANVSQQLNANFLNENTSGMMPSIRNEYNLHQTNVQANDQANVVIGDNTRVYNAFGIRQFLMISALLLLLGGGGFYAYRLLKKHNDKEYSSLSDIQKELRALANINVGMKSKLEKDGNSIDLLLMKAMTAMQNEDYSKAITYFEQAAEKTPASSIYKNIAFANEQLGNAEEAKANLDKAENIAPTKAESGKVTSTLKGKTVNLLLIENGGKLVAGSGEYAKNFADGNKESYTSDKMATFSFKDGKKASFNKFTVFVRETSSSNTTEIELFYGNDSATGEFTSFAKVKPQNLFLAEEPFQVFNFPSVKAKYIKIVTNGYTNEVELWGQVE
jgi:tetratricopeptide (TPR) repeat protein